MIQKEENSLNNFKNQKNNSKKKFINKNKKSGISNLKIKSSVNLKVKKDSILNPLNNAKSEINLLKNKNNNKIQNSKLGKMIKVVKKDIDLKTNYNVEDEKIENEINVDNYVSQKVYSSYLNIFKSYNSNENLNNENKIIKNKEFKSFSNLSTNNIPITNNFIENNIKSVENKNNKKEPKQEKENKNELGQKFSIPKFINNRNFNKNNVVLKKGKSIIEGYLSNYNIKSENYFNKLLNDGNKQQINLLNKNTSVSKGFNPEYDNQINNKEGNININSYNKNHLNSGSIETKTPFKNEETEKYISKDNLNKKEIYDFVNTDKKEFNNNNQINKDKKLEKNLSDMNIIYEENEQEKNYYNPENKFVYFSPNNNYINGIKSEKNKDIFKYLDTPIQGIHDEQSLPKYNKESNKGNKYSYFNINKAERKITFINTNVQNAKPSNKKGQYKNNNYLIFAHLNFKA